MHSLSRAPPRQRPSGASEVRGCKRGGNARHQHGESQQRCVSAGLAHTTVLHAFDSDTACVRVPCSSRRSLASPQPHTDASSTQGAARSSARSTRCSPPGLLWRPKKAREPAYPAFVLVPRSCRMTPCMNLRRVGANKSAPGQGKGGIPCAHARATPRAPAHRGGGSAVVIGTLFEQTRVHARARVHMHKDRRTHAHAHARARARQTAETRVSGDWRLQRQVRTCRATVQGHPAVTV